MTVKMQNWILGGLIPLVLAVGGWVVESNVKINNTLMTIQQRQSKDEDAMKVLASAQKKDVNALVHEIMSAYHVREMIPPRPIVALTARQQVMADAAVAGAAMEKRPPIKPEHRKIQAMIVGKH